MFGCEVAQAYDADQVFFSVHHRQPPDLHLCHLALDLFHRIVLEAPAHVVRHHFIDPGRVGKSADCRRPHDDVAVGKDPDQVFAVAYWQRADVQLIHFPRRLAHARFRRNRGYVPGHHITYLHRSTPKGGPRQFRTRLPGSKPTSVMSGRARRR